jgi:hypothetical protein
MSAAKETRTMKDKEKQIRREAAIAFVVEMKLAKDLREAAIPPEENFLVAIQTTRHDLLFGPLDIVIENLEDAADKARAAGDERADALFDLAERLKPGLRALEAVEHEFKALFGGNDGDMSPADSEQ